ncbi:hypothetical protein [Streptomyces flavidovirens]
MVRTRCAHGAMLGAHRPLRVRIECLAYADGLQLAQDISDEFTTVLVR